MTNISVQSMLANPALIPQLPAGSEVRSSDLLLPTSRERTVDVRIQDLSKVLRENWMVEALLQSCSRMSYTPPDQVQCPQFQTVLALADKVGFSAQEKVFIQYHEISGQKYVLIAEHHDDNRYQKLLSGLGDHGVKKDFAVFCEAICRHLPSERSYCALQFTGEKLAATQPWIFGLEDGGRALQEATMSFLRMSSAAPKSVLQDPQNASLTYESQSFFDDLHYNYKACWEGIVKAATNKSFTPAAASLFEDILKMLQTPLTLPIKRTQLYPVLWKNHARVQTWKDLFFSLAMIGLRLPNEFSPSEIALLKEQLAKPNNEKVYDKFIRTIIIEMRDRAFARALFSTTLPLGAVRVAIFGNQHLPGVIREIEHLGAAKAGRGKSDGKQT